jgi:hypothetical protein
LQTPIALGVFRNCRAETVPAHKTPLTSAARNAVLIIFVPMIALLHDVGWRQANCGYFAVGRSGPGSLTHPPVVPLKIWQMQAPLQGLVALHVPLQNGSKLDGVRSCRAETVPAQRTAVASAARNVFLIVLLMIHSSFQYQAEENEYGPAILPAWLCYFPEGATPAGRTVQNAVNGVVKEQKQPAAQGWVELQLPPQVVEPLASLRNCRAETVPAQRTPMTSAIKNIDLMFFMIAFLLVPGPNVLGQRRRPAILPVWLQ